MLDVTSMEGTANFRCEEFRNISLQTCKRIAKLNRRNAMISMMMACRFLFAMFARRSFPTFCRPRVRKWVILRQIHPGRLTWNTKTEVWKIIFLFIWVISSSMLIFRGVQCKGGKIMFHGTVDNQVVNLKFLDDLGTGEPDSLQHDTRLKHDQVYLVSCFRNLHDLLFVFPLGSLKMEFSA